MENLFEMFAGFLIIVLVIMIGIYIFIGLFLNKFNKLVNKKGTAMAWIPIVNLYLLGKLTVNKLVGWILVICCFLTGSYTVTINGVETTHTILPEIISPIFSLFFSITNIGLLIYGIVKYNKLKKNNKSIQDNNVVQQGQNQMDSQNAISNNVLTSVPNMNNTFQNVEVNNMNNNYQNQEINNINNNNQNIEVNNTQVSNNVDNNFQNTEINNIDGNLQNLGVNNINLNSNNYEPVIKKDTSDNNKEKNITTGKMIRFKYKAKDQEGKLINSYFDAENQIDVESFLINKGFEVIEIKEDKLSTSLGLTSMGTSKKMSSKDLNFFLTQLSTYVKSGIPLLDSMEILSRQSKKKDIQALYKKIVFNLNKGLSFSQCLEKEGKVFPKMLINMLKTSEMTGDLTGVLDDMAAYYKRQDSNRKQIINAMTYPSVLMIFAVAVLTFVITYVVPSFTSMYETTGSSLPGITVVIMNISDFVIQNWYLIIGGIILVVLIFVLLYKTSRGAKYAMQSFVMHIPVVKEIIKYNQLVTFTSTFSTLIKHDVFITDSMDILSKITENEIYKRIINDAISNLSKGNGVSVAFRGHWAFPETAYEMLVTGEKTGKLGEMMEHVSTFYQEEQTNIVARLKSLIEPVMIVLLAVIVGVILLAVVVPMFDIYSTII